MQVPLLDLKAQYRALRDPILKAVDETLASGAWVLGPKVAEFEKQIAAKVGASHGIGVASGTDALLLSIKALDAKPGDEIIAPGFTFFATAGAIVNAGCKPVFVDIEQDGYNLDVSLLESAITDRTIAAIPVHLFGQSADMDPITEICKRKNIAVIEDAAQTIGGTYKGRKVGSIGDTGCFSFYPTKNLGGAGDGGMITTNNAEIDEKIRVLRVHGAKPKYFSRVVGFNSRLDAVQAAILQVKLEHLDSWAAGRQKHAKIYDDAFASVDGIEEPKRVVEGDHVYNQYTIRVERGSRDDLQAHLREHQIGNEIYYPYPLHLLPAFDDLGYKEGDLPVSEHSAKTCISLPVFAEMNGDQQAFVIETIRDWAAKQ